MAKLLIDTQVLLWLLDNDKRLGARARSLMASGSNEVNLSYFSLLEIVLKAAIGKMTYEDSVHEDLAAMDIKLLSPDRAVLKNYRIHDSDNKDPFDNLLLTTAIIHGYQIVTSDKPILDIALPGLKKVDARR